MYLYEIWENAYHNSHPYHMIQSVQCPFREQNNNHTYAMEEEHEFYNQQKRPKILCKSGRHGPDHVCIPADNPAGRA